MKAVAFNGSPRPHGNTRRALETVIDELKTAGIETEIVQVGGLELHGCRVCLKCAETKDKHCYGWDDGLNPILDKLYAADIVLIGSPTYFASMTAETKAFIDRAGFVDGHNGNPLRRKIGAAVVAARRAGAMAVFGQVNNFFLIKEMIVPGSTYWNVGFGSRQGDILKDEEGVETFKNLGRNIAWLAGRLAQAGD